MKTRRCGTDCERCGACGPVDRRGFLQQMARGLTLVGVSAVAAACKPLGLEAGFRTPAASPSTASPTTEPPPIEAEGGEADAEPRVWTPPEPRHTGDLPAGEGTVRIDGLDTFAFQADQVETVRPDIFQPGHFSVYDAVVHLAEAGHVDLDAHFDAAMDTHVIDAINGEGPWWYQAYYANGWSETNAFRMDMFPYKDNMTIRLGDISPGDREAIFETFRAEMARLEAHGGVQVLPRLVIRTSAREHVFEDVTVEPHDLRTDVLQPGLVTGLDALISVWEAGLLPELKLTWYEAIGRADPVDSYWVEQVDEAVASGGCGLVYETGDRAFSGFRGSHIHLPADVRVTRSPEYALWFWICL